MRKIWKILIICCISILTLCGTEMYAHAAEETKVLMIGNSFTKRGINAYSVGTILEEIGEANQKAINVKTIVHANAHLSYYAFWSNAYKGYYDEVLCALREEQYDYIILQEQTKAAIENYENEMLPAVKQLYTYINAYQADAQVLLYEMASYSDGAKTKVDGKGTILSEQEFQERTLYGCARLQETTGIEIVPVGMQVYHARQLYPTISMISTDLKHPDYAGYYMAAACFYQKIYGESPVAVAEELCYCTIDDLSLSLLNDLVSDTISINKKSLMLAEGESETVYAEIKAPRERSGILSWKSLNTEIAIVDKNTGVVTAVAEGTTAIIAETTTGLMAVCNVTVENTYPASLSFGRTYYQVSVGDRIQLLPKMQNWQVGDTCKWSTGNAAVATVSANGTVTAKKMGKAVIKVKSSTDSSVSASYILYVIGKAPTKLSAKVTNATVKGAKIKLTWCGVYGAKKYRIYRYNSTTKAYTLVGTSTTTSYVDGTANPNQNYYYKVSAMAGNVLTESALSTKARIMILGIVTPKVSETKPKYIKLTWNRNKKATGYIIYRSTKKNSGYKKIATIHSDKKLYYYDSTVKKGKTYYYRIKTYKELEGKISYSAYSNVVKGKAIKSR